VDFAVEVCLGAVIAIAAILVVTAGSQQFFAVLRLPS
jgi:hypothetical protein